MTEGKEYLILKSKRMSFILLILSFVIFLILLIALFKYDSKNLFGILLITTLYGGLLLKTLYDVLDSKPLYTLDEMGIYKGETKLAYWTEISRFETKETSGRFLKFKQAIIFDKNEEKLATIDITHSERSLNELEQILTDKINLYKKIKPH